MEDLALEPTDTETAVVRGSPPQRLVTDFQAMLSPLGSWLLPQALFPRAVKGVLDYVGNEVLVVG